MSDHFQLKIVYMRWTSGVEVVDMCSIPHIPKEISGCCPKSQSISTDFHSHPPNPCTPAEGAPSVNSSAGSGLATGNIVGKIICE